jgi:hypothetical protein
MNFLVIYPRIIKQNTSKNDKISILKKFDEKFNDNDGKDVICNLVINGSQCINNECKDTIPFRQHLSNIKFNTNNPFILKFIKPSTKILKNYIKKDIKLYDYIYSLFFSNNKLCIQNNIDEYTIILKNCHKHIDQNSFEFLLEYHHNINNCERIKGYNIYNYPINEISIPLNPSLNIINYSSSSEATTSYIYLSLYEHIPKKSLIKKDKNNLGFLNNMKVVSYKENSLNKIEIFEKYKFTNYKVGFNKYDNEVYNNRISNLFIIQFIIYFIILVYTYNYIYKKKKYINGSKIILSLYNDKIEEKNIELVNIDGSNIVMKPYFGDGKKITQAIKEIESKEDYNYCQEEEKHKESKNENDAIEMEIEIEDLYRIIEKESIHEFHSISEKDVPEIMSSVKEISNPDDNIIQNISNYENEYIKYEFDKDKNQENNNIDIKNALNYQNDQNQFNLGKFLKKIHEVNKVPETEKYEKYEENIIDNVKTSNNG